MDEKKVVGRTYKSVTLAKLSDDDFWTVTSEMTEGRLEEGTDEWEYRTISAMSIDKDIQRAYETALVSVAQEFKESYVDRGVESMFDLDEKELKDGEKPKSLSD